MSYYLVWAVSEEGETFRKLIEAEDEVEVIGILERFRSIPTRIIKIPTLLGNFINYLRFRRIKRSDLIELFENLHVMIKSGVPLPDALEDIALETPNKVLKEILENLKFYLEAGLFLSQAMERYRKVFGDVAINLVAIGEETGELDKIFRDIAQHYARIEDFVSKTKQALIYPAFAITTVSFALIFWLVYVLPKMLSLFKEMNVEIPKATLALLYVSNFLKNYFLHIIVSILFLVILVLILRKKSYKFRYYTDLILLKIPVIRSILNYFYLAFFSEYFRLMITSGIPIDRILDTLEKAMGNEVYKKAIGIIKENIEAGISLSESIRRSGIFPIFLVRMVAVGEETGRLDEQFGYLSEHYYNRLNYITQNVAKVIEPLVIIVVGAFMAIIMISLLVPIYDLISKMSQQF